MRSAKTPTPLCGSVHRDTGASLGLPSFEGGEDPDGAVASVAESSISAEGRDEPRTPSETEIVPAGASGGHGDTPAVSGAAGDGGAPEWVMNGDGGRGAMLKCLILRLAKDGTFWQRRKVIRLFRSHPFQVTPYFRG